MDQVKSIAEWVRERGVGEEQLLADAALDKKVFDAILHGRYTPSPEQRRRLA